MQWLHTAWNDIRRGENIDLYLTIIAALVLTMLSLFGLSLSSQITTLTLAILSLIAYSLLGNRHQMQNVVNKLHQTSQDILLRRWPEEEVFENFKRADDILMIGVSLRRTVRNNYSTIEDTLRKGAKIKVLLVNPNSSAIEIAANRPYTNINVVRTQTGVWETLDSLKNLANIENGTVDVRIINDPLSFGGIFLDVEKASGILYIESYTFKMRDEDVPKLIFHPTDKYWYDFYRNQAKELWNNGTLPPTKET